MESLSLGATRHLVCDIAFIVRTPSPISLRLWLTKLDQLQFVNIPIFTKYQLYRSISQSSLWPAQ